MDRQLLERLIGAGVLVVALVVVVPAILDGDSSGDIDAENEPVRSVPANEPRRKHTIRLNQPTQTPSVALEITQPATDPGREAAKAQTAVKPKAEKVAALDSQPARTVEPSRASSLPDKSVSVLKTGWVVQLGSFSSQKNAQRLAIEVGGHGFSVFLMSLDRSGRKLYRVRVGPHKTRSQATEQAERLAKLGYSGQVMQ